MGLLGITQNIPQNEGSSNIIAFKNTAKHGILKSRCIERTHYSENSTKRKIFDFMV